MKEKEKVLEINQIMEEGNAPNTRTAQIQNLTKTCNVQQRSVKKS